MYLDLLPTRYFKHILQCVRMSMYPHCSPGFYAGMSVHTHVLTWTIRPIGRNETYKKLCAFIHIHRFATIAYICTELQDDLSEELNISLSKWRTRAKDKNWTKFSFSPHLSCGYIHKIKLQDTAGANVASIHLLWLQRDFLGFNLGEGKKWVSRGLIKWWAKAAAVQMAPLHR